MLAVDVNGARGKTHGLLGVMNGNPADDFTTPSGTIIPHDSDAKDIHDHFGNLCKSHKQNSFSERLDSCNVFCVVSGRTSQSSSLFTYTSGKEWSYYQDINFVPLFSVDECSSEVMAPAISLCEGDAHCLFDYCATKDQDIAKHTKDANENFVQKQGQFSKCSHMNHLYCLC